MPITSSFLCEKDNCRLEDVTFPESVPDTWKPQCPLCGELMGIKNRPPEFAIESLRQDNTGVWEGHNYGLGVDVTKRSEAMAVAKAKGLTWMGDDNREIMMERRREDVEVGHDLRRRREAGEGTPLVRETSLTRAAKIPGVLKAEETILNGRPAISVTV